MNAFMHFHPILTLLVQIFGVGASVDAEILNLYWSQRTDADELKIRCIIQPGQSSYFTRPRIKPWDPCWIFGSTRKDPLCLGQEISTATAGCWEKNMTFWLLFVVDVMGRCWRSTCFFFQIMIFVVIFFRYSCRVHTYTKPSRYSSTDLSPNKN